MDNQLRALLSSVLATPDDLGPRLVLADWLEDLGDHRAEKVRQHCATGGVYLRSHTLWMDGVGPSPSVIFLVLQLVPQPIAVEFDCRCAERVLPVFHREWPNDVRPDQLVAAVRSWLRGEQTKKRLQELAWGMADLVDERASQAPPGVVWDRDRDWQRYRAECAAKSAIAAALATRFPAGSDRWLCDACEAPIQAIIAAASPAREGNSQRRELAKLLRQNDVRTAKPTPALAARGQKSPNLLK